MDIITYIYNLFSRMVIPMKVKYNNPSCVYIIGTSCAKKYAIIWKTRRVLFYLVLIWGVKSSKNNIFTWINNSIRTIYVLLNYWIVASWRMLLATKRFASLHDCIIEKYVFKCTLNIKELIHELVNIYIQRDRT
jgi:hypothetical protein